MKLVSDTDPLAAGAGGVAGAGVVLEVEAVVPFPRDCGEEVVVSNVELCCSLLDTAPPDCASVVGGGVAGGAAADVVVAAAVAEAEVSAAFAEVVSAAADVEAADVEAADVEAADVEAADVAACVRAEVLDCPPAVLVGAADVAAGRLLEGELDAVVDCRVVEYKLVGILSVRSY